MENSQAIKRRERLPRSILKKAMDLADNKYQCSLCQIVEWRGQLLKPHIHHRNHNKFDNRIENLQYLCPNCHSIQHPA